MCAAPVLANRSAAFVAKWGTDDAGYNAVGRPMAFLTIAAALADLAANYPTASATAPHVVSLEPGTYNTPAFALPPFTFIVGNPDGPTDPTGCVVINLTGNVTLAAGWSVNQTAFGGFENITLRQTTAQTIDLTMPVPAAGNPARTLVLRNVRHDADSLSYEATSTADAIQTSGLIQDGNSGDAMEFSAGAQFHSDMTSAAPVLFNDTATIAAAIQAKGIFTSAAPSAVAPGISFVSSTGNVAARIGYSDVRALTLNRGGAGSLAVYADAVSIPLTANVTYAGTATTANLIRTTDAGGIGPAAGTFYGLNGQTIVGGAAGSWVVTANGTNQQVEITPSGTATVAIRKAATGGDILSFAVNRQNSATAALYFGADASTNGLIASNNAALRLGIDVAGTFTEAARITTAGRLLLGTAVDSGALLQIGANTTTAAGGLIFGTDCQIHRNGNSEFRFNVTAGDLQLQLARAGTQNARLLVDGANLYISSSLAGMSMILGTGLGTTALTLDSSQHTIAAATISTGSYTQAGLPAPTASRRATCTDSTLGLTAGVGLVVAGGGANVVPVFADGVNWRIG